jgi:hypothetical protein
MRRNLSAVRHDAEPCGRRGGLTASGQGYGQSRRSFAKAEARRLRSIAVISRKFLAWTAILGTLGIGQNKSGADRLGPNAEPGHIVGARTPRSLT